ncbi:hypothetical protein TNCV_2102321 [Trichonephila clavipes]|nr:hypothetical protein TNCV_2102321 [Trichonephila clavipes]
MPSRCSQSIFYSQRHRRSSSFHSNLGLSPFLHPRPALLSLVSFLFFFSLWMTVDDSLFLGTWTDKQSSIPYHDVCDAGLDFVGFFSLRSDMSVIGCGDGIREEGLRDDYLELKFYTVLRA